MTREDLIALLRDRGFIAIARNWAMGETVLVTHESLLIDKIQRPRSIDAYHDALYVRSANDGSWVMTDKVMREVPVSNLETLLAAIAERLGVSVSMEHDKMPRTLEQEFMTHASHAASLAACGAKKDLFDERIKAANKVVAQMIRKRDETQPRDKELDLLILHAEYMLDAIKAFRPHVGW